MYQAHLQQVEHEKEIIAQKCGLFESQLRDKEGRLANEL